MLLRPELKADVTDNIVAVVKYFNEENYNFVEDKTKICAYNSSQKDDFITVGMSKLIINETS